METLERILAGHPFFENLDPKYLALLAGCAANVRFRPGEFLFRSGEEARRFFLVREGKVALEITAPARAPLVMQTMDGGEIIGWSWLIPPYYWRFDGRATEDVRAIALDGACLRAKCEADHELGYEILKRFARIMQERMQATLLQLLDVYGPQA